MRLWVRGEDLHRVGPIRYTECSAVLRANDVGAWSFTVPADSKAAGKLVPGRGVFAHDKGTVFSGPITSLRESGADSRILEVSGVTDDVHLARRIVFPDPTKPGNQQTATGYWTRTGAAETLIRDLVRLNAGTGAIPDRRVLGLDAGVSEGRGGTVKANERFTVLLDAVNALAAGRLLWRVVHDHTVPQMRLEVFERVDRSRSVRFSRAQGSLTSYEWDDLAPEVTDVLVAGQGQGAARTLIPRSSPSPWGRVERFQDRRDTDDVAQLEQAGDETLAEGQAKASLKFEVSETAKTKRYGEHYQVGDTVTAVLKPATADFEAVAVSDVLRQAELQWGPDGKTVKLTVGDQTQDDPTAAMVAKIRDVQRRLRRSEGQ